MNLYGIRLTLRDGSQRWYQVGDVGATLFDFDDPRQQERAESKAAWWRRDNSLASIELVPVLLQERPT